MGNVSASVIVSFVASGTVAFCMLAVGAWLCWKQFKIWRETRKDRAAKKFQLKQIFNELSFDDRDWSLYTIDAADVEQYRKQQILNARRKVTGGGTPRPLQKQQQTTTTTTATVPPTTIKLSQPQQQADVDFVAVQVSSPPPPIVKELATPTKDESLWDV